MIVPRKLHLLIGLDMCRGKAFGIFNLRTLYLTCLVMFEAGSALCGGAPSMNALIVGRIWAGMGGAGIYLGYVPSALLKMTKVADKQIEHSTPLPFLLPTPNGLFTLA